MSGPAPLSGYATTQEFWATRYTQLDLQFINLLLTADHIAGGFVSRPNPAVRLDHNRAIKLPHAERFGQYLLRGCADDTGKWAIIVPALSLWTNPSGVEFKPDPNFPAIDAIEFGIFSVLRSTPVEIWDGQHRVLGIYIAVQRKEDEIRDLADRLAKARAAGSSDAGELEDQLKATRDERRRLGAITIPVSIALETDVAKIATLFADVADNAKGINATALGRLDHRQVFNRVAGIVISGEDGWTLLQGLVDDDNAYTTHNNPYWTTWRDVVDVSRTLWLGYGARWSEQQEQAKLADEESEILATTQEFYDVLCEAFPDIEDVLTGTIDARELRGGGTRTSLLASSTTIKALASAYHDLRFGKEWTDTGTRRYARQTNLPALTRDEIADGFSKLPPMDAGSESKIDPFWKALGLFQHPWSAPTARAGNIRTFGMAITDHVRDNAQ